MKENIKIFLLGVIAVASVVNVFQLASLKKGGTLNEHVAAETASPNTTAEVNIGESALGQNKNFLSGTSQKTTITWSEMIHDFDHVEQASKNSFSFHFTNSGTAPLLITSAVGSCGCTLASYPRDPIKPGESGSIDITYNPTEKQEGKQEKTVIVTANTNPVQTTLKIRAFVDVQQ